MTSAHARFLFESCDASKKRTSERSERMSFFLFLIPLKKELA